MKIEVRTQKPPEAMSRGDLVETPGINFDSTLTFVAFRRNVLVLHASGGTHWAGIGSDRKYHGARFMVLAVEEIVEREMRGSATGLMSGFSLRCDELVDFAPRKGGVR